MCYVWLVNAVLFYTIVSDQLYSYSTWILYAQKKKKERKNIIFYISNLKNINQNIMFNLSTSSFLTKVFSIKKYFN